MRFIPALCTLIVASFAFGREMPLPPEPLATEQERLRDLWPADLEWPKGLQAYQRTEYAQALSITNGRDANNWFHFTRDEHFTNSPTQRNPNRVIPDWAVSGGLHGIEGWKSIVAVSIPGKVSVWSERVEIGARRPVPKVRWEFPDGTLFVDVLSAEGKVFEVRQREKVRGQWKAAIVYERPEARPEKYTGPGKTCARCHSDDPGENYGIQLRREDGTFTWTPYVDGTWKFDRSWPLAIQGE